MSHQHVTDFQLAFEHWRGKLRAAGYSSEVVWRFRNELTIRPFQKASDGGFFLSYAHDFIEIKNRDAEGVFLDLLAKGLPIVFQLLVADASYSVCTLAFDPWESEEEDYCKKDGVYYSLDEPYSESEAITSKEIWIRHRVTQSRSLSGLDFIPQYSKTRENKTAHTNPPVVDGWLWTFS